MGSRNELIQYYRWLREYGLNDSHSGNASVLDSGTVWVTPTGACADTLLPDELIACRPGEDPAPGASLDAPLHLNVYGLKPDAGAVLHSHGAYTVAVTLDGKDFVPLDFEGQYYFPHVPVLDIPFDRYLDQSPNRVARTLLSHPVCVVRGHGVYATAPSLNQAYKWTCSLELSAKTAYIAKTGGTA